jgi:hypothetical protein
MQMNKGLRYYILGICMILIAVNIPDIKTLIHDKVMIAQPKALTLLKFAYDDISLAVIPLVGPIIGKPQLIINGQIAALDTTDDMGLNHGQSLTATQINSILIDAGSPAIGTGDYWIKYGEKHKIDAAYMLAIFYYESGFATNKEWAGYKEDTTHTYNIGNMICAGYQHCYGRFRDYSKDSDPWASAIEDNTHLLAIYRNNDGIKDFGTAIKKWAPPTENNTKAYVSGAESMIRAWRNTNKVIITSDAQSVSAPISQDSTTDFGLNVKSALNARNGALRNITIKDGEQWSFNETVGNPDTLDLAIIVNKGDGWCDLACRYIQVFKGLGLHISHGSDVNSDDIVFLQHGGISLYSCTYDESPYIWSAGNKGFDNGMQDLVVNNRTGKTIKISVVDNKDKTATIVGKME